MWYDSNDNRYRYIKAYRGGVRQQYNINKNNNNEIKRSSTTLDI